MPRLPPYVAAKGAALVFRRRLPARVHRPETPLRLSVALRTRDPREAGWRAAWLNALAEAGWRMGGDLSRDDLAAILKLVARAGAALPDLPPPARAEAEAAIDAEARRAIAGLPNRLGDPAFLDAFGWSETPGAAEVAEQLRFSIGGHLDAYDDALRRGEPPVPAMEALRARLDAPAPARSATPTPSPATPEPEIPAKTPRKPTKTARQEPPGEPKRPPARAALRPGNPDGWQEFAGRYLDRRRAGYLCETPDETADLAVGERFRGASLGNYQAAVRLWADTMGNRPVRDYAPQDAREFLALLARVPAGHGKGRPVPVREAIRLADEQERRAMVEIDASGASPGAIEVAKERARTPRLKLATLERYRGNLSQIFAWAVASGLRPENPFAGVAMSKRAKAARAAAEPGPARRAWTPAELRTLFAHPREHIADPLWWAPRIAAGTGMRMEEVLSLRGRDFRDDGDGGWLVAVGQSKTLAGRRDIPLASALAEVGLVALAVGCGDEFLFAELPRDRERGRLSAHYTKTFGRHRRRLGLTARGLDFHGLRGTPNAAMEAGGASLTVRQAILGHSSSALADSAYLRAGPDWRGRRAAVEAIPLWEWFRVE